MTDQPAHVGERLERHHLRDRNRPGQRRRPVRKLYQRGHLAVVLELLAGRTAPQGSTGVAAAFVFAVAAL